ncbi:arylsulfatase B [Trichonephila clavipes]|nr:arylsulfatase B [Trichonephila clavipes]
MPTSKGFDTFFGYCNGFVDYYDYTHFTPSRTHPDEGYHEKVFFGIDLHNGTEVVKDVRGHYATDLFTEKANLIIENHNPSQPLFLYLSHLAVHTANKFMPLQAPLDLIDQFDYIKNESRRAFAGMTASLDNSIGKLFEALHNKSMLSNTILVFASDNGGETDVSLDGYSSNYPLRGKKSLIWEGGIRVPAFIWSPLLQLRKPRVSKQLMHVTDWLPTLYRAAAIEVSTGPKLNGIVPGTAFLHALLRHPIGFPDSCKRSPEFLPDVMNMIESNID